MTGADTVPARGDVEVTAVVVTWRSLHLLDSCLRSLAELTPAGCRLRTVVVDNASGDGTVEMLRRDWPEVEVIVNDENVGFTRANNQAVRVTGGEHLLLINADARLTPGCLQGLLDRMDRDPRAAIVAPRLVYGDGRWQRWTAGAAPSVVSAAVFFLFLERLAPRWFGPRSLYLHRDVSRAFQPDWVCSACMLVRRTAMEEIGLMDESLFCYMDDVDLCERARRAGWHVWYEPEAEAVHLMGQSSTGEPGGVSPLALPTFNRYVAQTRGPLSAALVRAVEVVGFTARAGLYATRAALPGRGGHSGRKARAHWAHLKLSLERSPSR